METDLENDSSEFSTPYTLRDGRRVVIKIDDCGESIQVVTDEENARCIGGIELEQDEEEANIYKLTRAYLDENSELLDYTRQGIGRRSLQLHSARFQSRIWTESNDGHTRSDGSHLTGDAPAFIEQMRKEGVISSDSRHELDDFDQVDD